MKTFFQRPDQVDGPLHIITTVFNPIRFRQRWKLYEDFVRMCEQQGDSVILYTVEVAFGHRKFVITEAGNPRHLQLRTKHEFWLKENAQNLMVPRLPADAKKIAFIDADVSFARQDWANETLQQLEHYPIVQMWTEAVDLGPQHQVIQTHRGFAYCHTHKVGGPKPPCGYGYDHKKRAWWHPGFAWAMTRDTFDAMGGLLDFCILGSADHHMANGLIGSMDQTILPKLSPSYKKLLRAWQHHARSVRAKVGYIDGTILHYFHGPKASRRYVDRWKILVDHQFSPELHLVRDWQGLWQFAPDIPIAMRDQIMAYHRQRNEDQVEADPAWLDTMLGK